MPRENKTASGKSETQTRETARKLHSGDFPVFDLTIRGGRAGKNAE